MIPKRRAVPLIPGVGEREEGRRSGPLGRDGRDVSRYGEVGLWPASSCASRAALSPASCVASSFGLKAPLPLGPACPESSAASRAALSPASCAGSSLDLKDPVVVVPVVLVVVAASLACTLPLCCFAVAARATLARTP